MESGEGEKVDSYLLAVQHSQIPAPGYLSTGFTPPLSKLISSNLKHLNQHRLVWTTKIRSHVTLCLCVYSLIPMNNHREQITQAITFSTPPSAGWVKARTFPDLHKAVVFTCWNDKQPLLSLHVLSSLLSILGRVAVLRPSWVWTKVLFSSPLKCLAQGSDRACPVGNVLWHSGGDRWALLMSPTLPVEEKPARRQTHYSPGNDVDRWQVQPS